MKLPFFKIKGGEITKLKKCWGFCGDYLDDYGKSKSQNSHKWV